MSSLVLPGDCEGPEAAMPYSVCVKDRFMYSHTFTFDDGVPFTTGCTSVVSAVLEGNTLKLQTENPEHEQAEEEVEVDYGGSNLEIGFNVNYLLDALGVMTSDEFRFLLSSSDAGGLLKEVGSDAHAYVVMPMRL